MNKVRLLMFIFFYLLAVDGTQRSKRNYDKLIINHDKTICFKRDFKRKKYQDWKKMLIKYTGGYDILKKKRFAPDTHLGGGAVDLTIMKGKKELSMGGIKLNEKSHLNYFEKKKKLTKKEKEIRDNRRLLKKVMKKARFKPSLHEWWHWGYKK